MTDQVLLWLGFGAFVVTIMVLDLGVFHRKAHAVSLREAAIWTVVWVSLALAFNAVIYWERGSVAAIKFLTGYIIEWSLSMDNVFVFAVIFTYFAVPAQYQHRVLFWGILGAVVMRLTFILAGAALLERFHWVIYPMGAFLVLTGIKLFFQRNKERDVGTNWVLRLASRLLPVTGDYVGQRFFVRRYSAAMESIEGENGDRPPGALGWEVPSGPSGQIKPVPFFARQVLVRQATRWMVTPLFLVLLVVETTDLAFAVDSIPAIFAVTRDPFIVFTSNVFAILGLRALYFLLAGAMKLFRYLSVGLAAILCFVGVKMLLSEWYDIPIAVSLGVVGGILTIAVLGSLLVSKLENGCVVVQPAVESERVEVEA